MATIKKLVKCPHCSKRLSLQGLNGHLRFVHGVGAEDVRATMKQGTVEDRAGRVLELMRRLKEIREQRKELSQEGFWWPPDRDKEAANAAFAKAFENLEAEILVELRNLGLLDEAQ